MVLLIIRTMRVKKGLSGLRALGICVNDTFVGEKCSEKPSI